MIVGEAQIVVRAITDKVRKDIQSAFRDARPDMKAAGEDAGKAYSEGFTSKLGDDVKKALTPALKDIENEVDKSGKKAGKNFKKGFSSELSDLSKAFKQDFSGFIDRLFGVSSALDFMGPIIANVVSLVGSLVGGLFSIGAAAAQAAPAISALAGVYASLGQAMGVVKIAFGGKDLKNALKGNTAALKNLGPAARDFVKNFTEVKKKFEDVRKSVQAGLFPGLSKALNTISKNVFPILEKRLKSTGQIMGGMANTIANTVAHSGNFDKILKGNNQTLRIFSGAVGPLVQMLLKFGAALQPITHRFATWLTQLVRARNASTSVGGLTKTLGKAGNIAADLGKIMGNLGRAIFDLGKAAAPAGQGLIKSFKDVTAEWDKTLSTPAKQAELRKFFQGTADNLRSISSFIGKVVAGMAALGDNKGVKVFFDGISKSTDKFKQLGDELSDPKIAQALANLVNNVVDLVSALTQGGQIKVFISTIGDIVKAIATVIKAGEAVVPDGLGAFLLGLIAIFRGGRVVATLTGFGKTYEKLTSTLAKPIISPLKTFFLGEVVNAETGERRLSQSFKNLGQSWGDFRQSFRDQKTFGKNGAIVAGVPTVTQSFGKLKDSLKAVGEELRGVGIGVGLAGLAASMESAHSSGLKLSNLLGGGLSAAIAGLSVGGPLGAAVAGLGLFFTILTGGIATLKNMDKSLKNVRTSFNTAFKKGDASAMIESFKAATKNINTTKKASEGFLSTIGVGAKAVVNIGKLGAKGLFHLGDFSKVKKDFEDFANSSRKDVNKVQAAQIEAARQQLQIVKTLKLGDKSLLLSPQAFLQLAENAARAKAANDAAVKSIRDIGNTATSAEQSIGSLTNQMEAQARAIVALNRNTSIAISKGAGQALIDNLKNQGAVGAAVIAKLARSTPEEVQKMTAAFNRLNNVKLDKKTIEIALNQGTLAQTLGITKKQLNSLPKQVVSTIVTQGGALSVHQIQAFANTAKGLNGKQIRVLLRMSGADPKKINGIVTSIENARKRALNTVIAPKVKVDTNSPLGKFGAIQKGVDNTNKKSINIKAKLVGASAVLGQASGLHASLVRQFSTPITQHINIVTSATRGHSVPKTSDNSSASGGRIVGPGTGTSDSILQWLSNGEFVIKAASAKAIGYNNLNRLNSSGRLPSQIGRNSTVRTNATNSSVNINVVNPAPERASSSVSSTLRTRAINSGWAGF